MWPNRGYLSLSHAALPLVAFLRNHVEFPGRLIKEAIDNRVNST